MQAVNQTIQYYKYSREGWLPVQTKVISETAVSLTVNGENWLSFQCSPADLEALAVGFLFNEKLIESHLEIASVHVCQSGDNVDVWLNKTLQKPVQWMRTSGCSGGFTQAGASPDKLDRGKYSSIDPDLIVGCIDQLLQAQEIYREARGIHCSAIGDGHRLVVQAEDIGRHNTLDKLAGKLLLDPIEISPKILLTTGRISSEMMNKAIRLQAEVVLSRTSPTTSSIALAEQAGVTLIGYARRTQMFVYSHPERLGAGDWLNLKIPLSYEEPSEVSR